MNIKPFAPPRETTEPILLTSVHAIRRAASQQKEALPYAVSHEIRPAAGSAPGHRLVLAQYTPRVFALRVVETTTCLTRNVRWGPLDVTSTAFVWLSPAGKSLVPLAFHHHRGGRIVATAQGGNLKTSNVFNIANGIHELETVWAPLLRLLWPARKRGGDTPIAPPPLPPSLT